MIVDDGGRVDSLDKFFHNERSRGASAMYSVTAAIDCSNDVVCCCVVAITDGLF